MSVWQSKNSFLGRTTQTLSQGSGSRGLAPPSLEGIEHDVRVVGLHPGATKTERKISQPQARVAKELGDAGRLGGVRRQVVIRSTG